MKKKYVFEITFRCRYTKQAHLELFSEEFHPYVTSTDSSWQTNYPYFGDYQVKVVKSLWSGCYQETTDEERYSARKGAVKIEEKYYETFKHANVLSCIEELKDANFKILNLKSEKEFDRQLCQVLLNIGDEPIEIRFKVEYDRDGTRT